MGERCEVWFYHLERTTLDQALPGLLERTLARGWRALVRTPERERVDHLDGWLWSYRDESFLPHGAAGEADAERQPILITRDTETSNGADVLFLLDNAEPGSLQTFQRCVVLFDGRDDDALAAARRRWREMKASGHPSSYWRQTDAGWEKQG